MKNKISSISLEELDNLSLQCMNTRFESMKKKKNQTQYTNTCILRLLILLRYIPLRGHKFVIDISWRNQSLSVSSSLSFEEGVVCEWDYGRACEGRTVCLVWSFTSKNNSHCPISIEWDSKQIVWVIEERCILMSHQNLLILNEKSVTQ